MLTERPPIGSMCWEPLGGNWLEIAGHAPAPREDIVIVRTMSGATFQTTWMNLARRPPENEENAEAEAEFAPLLDSVLAANVSEPATGEHELAEPMQRVSTDRFATFRLEVLLNDDADPGVMLAEMRSLLIVNANRNGAKLKAEYEVHGSLRTS